jgi:hypothetical protein
MRFIQLVCLIGIVLLDFRCSKSSKKNEAISLSEDVGILIRSNDPNKMVEGFYLIGEKRMTEYVPAILQEIYDPRISHHVKFKGMSVYQSKMIALSKISALEPPKKITYKPDTVIVDFYLKWARKNGYLKN